MTGCAQVAVRRLRRVPGRVRRVGHVERQSARARASLASPAETRWCPAAPGRARSPRCEHAPESPVPHHGAAVVFCPEVGRSCPLARSRRRRIARLAPTSPRALRTAPLQHCSPSCLGGRPPSSADPGTGRVPAMCADPSRYTVLKRRSDFAPRWNYSIATACPWTLVGSVGRTDPAIGRRAWRTRRAGVPQQG
jgi:hypothetical protein